MSDLRAALEAAAKTTADATQDSAPPPEPAAEPTPQAEPVDAAPDTPAPERTAAERARDLQGRFAPKAPDATTPAKVEAKPAETTKAETPTPASPAEPQPPPTEPVRPPQSWKATAREHWGKLPPEVQAEVARVDKEVRTLMQESAPARKLAQDFQQVVAPYRALMNGEPMQVIGGLLQTAAALQTAPVTHKAQMIARLVKDYGIPIDALAAAIDGQPMPQGQAQAVDPAALAAQVQQQVWNQIQAQAKQAATQRHSQEVETWAQGKEFLDDVRGPMADLIEVAARRGKTMSLDEAYTTACRLDPDISGVLQQREAAKAAQAAQAATQRTLAAASSIKSQPAAVTNGAKSDDLRGQLMAAAARQRR